MVIIVRYHVIPGFLLSVSISLYVQADFACIGFTVGICKYSSSLFVHLALLSINQSINARFVERRYTTRPGAPAIVSCKHDQKYILESFFECTVMS